MTANQLRDKFANEFAFGQWPGQYHVDADTYANVCQEIFNQREIKFGVVRIALGINRGVMFRNVELILETK